jgi:hypothetical protein
MPFTFAHPAAVLPFRNRKFLSTSALVIGSMAPDLAYFYQMKLDGRYSHTIEGVFLLDLPIALGTFLVFHFLLKQSLIPNLPKAIKNRLLSLLNFDAWAYIKRIPIGLVISLLMGIFSHILWDSFTHSHKEIGYTWATFSQELIFIANYEIPLYELLQHSSTLLGLAIMVVVFRKMPSSKNTIESKSSSVFWVILLLASALIFLIRAFYGIHSLGNLFVVGIAAIMYGLIISSLVVRLFIPGIEKLI